MSALRDIQNEEDKQTNKVASQATYPIHDVNNAKELVEHGESDQGFASTWKSPWSKPRDLDAIATKRSVFDDEELSKFYVPSADYENAHRFDAAERWTYREERTVMRKIDFRILLWVLVS